MHHGSGQQGMKVGLLEPLEQVFDQMRHAVRRRSHVDELRPLVNAHSTLAECPRVSLQSLHQGAMSFEEIRCGSWLQRFQKLVSGEGVLHFLNFPWQATHAPPGKDRRDLIEAE